MSRLGEFAVRYEKLQRGLQSQAELKLSQAVSEQRYIEMELTSVVSQYEAAQTRIREGKSGRDWLYEYQQLQVLDMQIQSLVAKKSEAARFAAQCESEVKRVYTEAERWEDVGEKELQRDVQEQLRVESLEADERVVQLFGRAAR